MASVLALPEVGLADQGAGQGKQMQGQQGGKGGSDHGMGQHGDNAGRGLGGIFRDISGMEDDAPGAAAEDDDGGDDSDRPAWAGVPGGKDDAGGGPPSGSGSKKGDLFGDLWLIDRDSNGVPILTEDGYVQPLDIDGNPIPLDEEGHPIDETLTVEVELGRLNVGRAPVQVLDRRADEVVTLINSATAITTDASGRIVLTVDGEQKTIDSPLENLAIYVALLEYGYIPGVTFTGTIDDPSLSALFDNAYTVADLSLSSAFLAAATDKTGEFTSDEIAYIDAFLGINTQTTPTNVTYSVIDYSTFSYDRYATFGDATADILVLENGVYVPKEDVAIYEMVFGTGDNVVVSGSLDAYTQAAEDARMVIEFIHNFALPE